MQSERRISAGIEQVCPEAECHGDQEVSPSESLFLFLPCANTVLGLGAPSGCSGNMS